MKKSSLKVSGVFSLLKKHIAFTTLKSEGVVFLDTIVYPPMYLAKYVLAKENTPLVNH